MIIKNTCRKCRHYEPVKGKYHGYCRNKKSYYNNLKVTGGKLAADRCFERKEK